MVAAIGRGEGQHLAVLDRVPRSVRLNLFVPRVAIHAVRHGVAVALVAARHTARGPQPRVPLMRCCGQWRCRGCDKHHDQSDQREHFLISKMRAPRSCGRKPAVHHSDNGYPDSVRRPLVPRRIERPRLSSGQAFWAVLLLPLAGGLEARPPRPDELLDKRSQKRLRSLRARAPIRQVPNAASSSPTPGMIDSTKLWVTRPCPSGRDRCCLRVSLSSRHQPRRVCHDGTGV
jgi:hypothetical protein